jgi:hypothetical protein
MGGDMVVDPVARALIVIIGPAPFAVKARTCLIRGKPWVSSSSRVVAALILAQLATSWELDLGYGNHDVNSQPALRDNATEPPLPGAARKR